ncbi:MAG: HAMP domain-containing protein [Spirochaetia bacterium]|nr:HAMP domain-containing protein [Spirochaetia bacterium]
MRFPFAVKLALAISILAVSATGLSVFFVFQTTRSMVIRLMGDRLKDVGRTAQFMLEEDDRAAIKKMAKEVNARLVIDEALKKKIAEAAPGDQIDSPLPPEFIKKTMLSPEFIQLNQFLRRLRAGSKQNITYPGFLSQKFLSDERDTDKPQIRYSYLIIATPGYEDHNVATWLVDSDYEAGPDEKGVEIGLLYKVKQKSFHNAFLGKASAENDFYSDSWGTWHSAALPILDQDGSVIAVFGMDYDATSEANRVKVLMQICFAIVAASLVLSIIVALILARILAKPVRALREGAERVRARDFSTFVDVKSRDELGILAGTFNNMVTEIRDYAKEMETLNDAYYRFVPKEFLQHLERTSIVDVKLGDQVQREMAVLFSDIRSFTTLSEALTPKENFNLLNQYLSVVSPVIRQNQGFIDKYIGDAVMALFPESAVHAVNAGIAMQRALRDYNEMFRMNQDPIRIGVGIHSGLLMLGTVGEEKRMEGTVISDAVNLASRLEGLTKKFGSGILISNQVYERIDAANKFQCRYLGRVRVKGKKESVRVYEVMDGDSDAVAALKVRTMAEMEQGIELFTEGKFRDSLPCFEAVLKVNPADTAARAYFDRAERIVKKPIGTTLQVA